MSQRDSQAGYPSDAQEPSELGTFTLLGIVEGHIVELATQFRGAERAALVKLLRERAGHPWAARAFESACDDDEAEARRRGLFDLVWHHRALDVDPMVTASYSGAFDVLVDAARKVAPDLAELLAHLDANDPANPRPRQGPEWWRAWHEAAGTRSGGWLDREEVRALSEKWWRVATPEVEEACLAAQGVTYTHPGCWKLLSDLGGFFAQCASERRVVVVEVDA